MSQFRRSVLRRPALALGWYIAVMAACGAAVVAAPTVAMVAFLGLAAHHFGVSDAPGTRGRCGVSRAGHGIGLARGVVVIGAPFVFQPAASWAPFERIAGALGASSGAAGWWAALVAGVAVALGFAVCVCWRRSAVGGVWGIAGLCAYVALAALAPPLLTIGVYFVGVHALGHCLRARTPGRPAEPPSAGNAWRVHVWSLAWTVPSVAAVVILAGRLGGVDAASVSTAFIAFCAVATLPHHLLWLRALPGSGDPA